MSITAREDDATTNTATTAVSRTPNRAPAVAASTMQKAGRPRRKDRSPWLAAAAVLVIGCVVTAALTFGSHVDYSRTQRRLTTLDTQLTGYALGIAQVDLERRLGQAVDVAAASASPVAAFRSSIAPSLAPKGPFLTASLTLLRRGRATVLAHLGAAVIGNPHDQAPLANDAIAARTHSLVTARALGKHEQRLVFLMAAPAPNGGNYIVSAGEALPANRRIAVAPGSPDSNLDIALYFGATAKPSALLETTSSSPPPNGAARTTVPFGNNVLTLVASPKEALAGTWAQDLPWGILIVGLLFSAGIALMTERLVRRRQSAEHLAQVNRQLFREQREVSETLQQSLLPKELPTIDGVEMAAVYRPSAKNADIGGDWYSAIAIDETRFTFIVGDVSGHGISAAAAMASLRFTMRTLARLGHDPASILMGAREELELDRDGHFATVLVGQVDLQRGVLTLASAGHLGPFLLQDGHARHLEVTPGPPIGAALASTYQHTTVPIARGVTLVAFTDGLIERRTYTIDDSLERARLLLDARFGSVEETVNTLVDALEPDHGDDDTAVLAIHWAD